MVVSRETLAGLRVALPRLKSDDAIAAALKTAGAQVDTFALTQTVAIESAQLEQVRERLAAGYYTWVVLSSWRATQAVLPQLNTLALAPASAPAPHSPTSAPTHLAVVGHSTADWVNTHCTLKPTLVGAGSAAKLLEIFPTPPARQATPTGPTGQATICLPQSQLAAPTLAQGLSQLGWQVDTVATYTTAPLAQLPAHFKTQWQAGAWDAVVVTAGSNAQALLQLLGPPPKKTAVVSIGQSTSARCRELGLRVDATAATPRAEHITQAIINLFKAKDFS